MSKKKGRRRAKERAEEKRKTKEKDSPDGRIHNCVWMSAVCICCHMQGAVRRKNSKNNIQLLRKNRGNGGQKREGRGGESKVRGTISRELRASNA